MKQNTGFMSALLLVVKPLKGFMKLTFFTGIHREIQVSGNGKAKEFGQICMNREFILVHVHIDIPVLSLSNKNRYL